MQLFKRTILLLLCIMFVAGCSKPEATLHDSQGKMISMSHLEGKWVVVHYWAGWCDNCVKEVKSINQFYHATSQQSVFLYGANYDHLSGASLKDAMQKLHIQFPVYAEDPAKIFHLVLSDYLPMTFIIDPKGNVVKKIVGPTTASSLLAMLAQLQTRT